MAMTASQTSGYAVMMNAIIAFKYVNNRDRLSLVAVR